MLSMSSVQCSSFHWLIAVLQTECLEIMPGIHLIPGICLVEQLLHILLCLMLIVLFCRVLNKMSQNSPV